MGNAESQLTMSLHQGVYRTAAAARCQRGAGGVGSKWGRPPPFALVLAVFRDLEGRGQQRDRPGAGTAGLVPGCGGQLWGSVPHLLQRGTRHYGRWLQAAPSATPEQLHVPPPEWTR